MLLNCGALKDSWELLGLRDQTSQSQRKLTLNIHWKDWYWSWSSNTLATWCKQLTHWKRPWCWERWRAGGKGDDRGDGWMASLTQWTWVWVNSRRMAKDREVLRAAVHKVAKSQTRLSDWRTTTETADHCSLSYWFLNHRWFACQDHCTLFYYFYLI